ncbi:MAG: tetratricopeptide repeat protein [Symplocastrum torsivum CPER-KK1]|jgi:tetratricopeptide (TPR) repeat protein|uniref:Tetratricopeptide repeat protein n=1 Tax=Symplocastrum torsivum CPER-KK1 TaxID=450513 RepID=A0A951PIN2_9CYAN|nr:tetratricopeptide repeat protein [Symplocastrum torsivum CPER-KK1]
MSYRVQRIFVSQKRNPWINVVLVLAVLAFVGFSMVPLLGSIFEGSEPSARTTPAATPSISADKKAELEAQAKGYELVVQREPQNVTALKGLLEVRLQQGDVQGAIAPLEQLAKLNPDQTDYAVLLAQAKQQTGDREGAAQTYRTILASKPGNLNALQGLVSLLIQQDRPEAAIGLLQDTLKTATQVNEIQPGSVDVISVQLLLGQIYAAEQRYTQAIAVYDESIKANQQDFRPVLAKALVLKQQGKIAEAKPLFTTAVSLAPPQYKDQVKQLSGDTPAPTSSPPTGTTPAPNSSPPTGTTPAPTNSPANATPDFPEPLPSASP